MLLRDAIGSTLRRIRLDSGRTLRDVALDAAISMPYLSEIERGRKEASSEVLAGILRALGLTLLDLLAEVSEEQRAQQRMIDLAAERQERQRIAAAGSRPAVAPERRTASAPASPSLAA
jgi:transcriptional regulator with XRE-family HTH domain